MLGSVGLAGAVLGSVPLQAADYTGANVDEFIAEMTRDYGFASEQLRDLFKPVSYTHLTLPTTPYV